MTKPVPIPFPLSSAPGAQPQESAGRLINVFAEPLGDAAGARQAYHRSPGLSAFATTGFAGFRGAILANGLLYAALNGEVVSINGAGVVTTIGVLSGTDPCIFAKNNKTPTADIVVVNGNGAFQVLPASVISYPGGVLPAVNSVCFQDGYFFFTTGDKRVFGSAINDVAINALTFITLQGRSAQAGVRVVAYKGILVAFTTSSCEIWTDTAQPYPAFPYSRLAVLDRGLLASAAVAGDTEGFGSLLWVGDDYGVYQFNNSLQHEKVSPPDLDRLIQTQAKVDAAQLFAGCYSAGGRSMWTLSSPNWTWEFNIATQKWNERSSFYSGLLKRWRGIGGVRAFGNWLVGDDQTGNVLAIDPTNFAEVSNPQLFRLESGPTQDFPNRIRVARTDIDIIAGTGQTAGANANITNPVIMIYWSDDDGINWVGPISRPIGAQANAKTRVWATSLGRTGAQGRRWRYDVSDPVYVGILGATMDASARAG